MFAVSKLWYRGFLKERGKTSASCIMCHHQYSQDATGMTLGTQRKAPGENFDCLLALHCLIANK
jgi:hypothetical protein